jgi:hypothetical protein
MSACASRPTPADGSTSDGGSTSVAASSSEVASDAEASSSSVSADASSSAAGTGDTGASDTGTAGVDVGPTGCAVEWLPPVCWGVACEDLECGEPWSRLDADGCARPECVTDADCAADRHCSPRFVAAPCVSGLNCSDEGGMCLCGGNLGCNLDARGYCLDRTEFPPAELCAAMHVPCEYLADRIGQTAAAVEQVGEELVPELAARVAECQAVRVERAVGECGLSPCTVVCALGDNICGAKGDCESLCDAVDPAVALEFAQLLAASPGLCADCPSCEATGNPLCTIGHACGG